MKLTVILAARVHQAFLEAPQTLVHHAPSTHIVLATRLQILQWQIVLLVHNILGRMEFKELRISRNASVMLDILAMRHWILA